MDIYFKTKEIADNFIEELIKISDYYQAKKVGFANEYDNLIYKFYLPNFNNDIWYSEFKSKKSFYLVNNHHKGGEYKISGNYLCKII